MASWRAFFASILLTTARIGVLVARSAANDVEIAGHQSLLTVEDEDRRSA